MLVYVSRKKLMELFFVIDVEFSSFYISEVSKFGLAILVEEDFSGVLGCIFDGDCVCGLVN